MSPEDPDVLDAELEERLRRGLAALAEETPAPRPTYRRHLPVAAAAAAVVIAAAAFVASGLGGSDDPGDRNLADPRRTATSGPVPPPLGGVIEYDVDRLVTDADRVVVGTVTDVERHAPSEATGGLAYVLASIEVDEVVKGPTAASLVAFDYDYEFGDSVSSESGLGARFVRGERVLLFLSSSAGTVHEQLQPPHWQVTGGAQGLYVMDGDEPEAPFTLFDVRERL
jgi:hypothetical protein